MKTKLLLVALLCIFIISSCKKPYSPCTLTPEQAPQIRGIKLGMSYDEIAEKFRIKCSLKIISPQQFLHTKTRYSIRIGDADWQNKTAIKESEKYDLKGLDSGCFTYLGDSAIGFNPFKFPELQEIESLKLSFDERKLITEIEVFYHLKKPAKKFTFSELIDSLNLSQWTNWDIEAEKNSGVYDNKMSRGTLLCKNLVIEPSIEYFTDSGDTYSVGLDIESITDEEAAFIRNAIAKARNEEEQKKRQAAENSNAAQKKRIEEENRVRQPFKP